MKHVFILNPNSGKKRNRDKLINEIRTAAESLNIDYEIYFTKGPGDCKVHARELCEEYAESGIPLRIYGCGGDGTVNELVNGVYGFDNVEAGVIPMGTGNDYVRNFGPVEAFKDIKNQILGKSQTSDLIKYKAEYKDEITEGYCANMFNIGFDCNVADYTQKVKSLPLISGSMAYLISVAIILIKKKGANLKIEYDNGVVHDGKVLLTAIANGQFCGGGIKSAPEGILDDGFMDVSVIKNVARRTFITLFPSYSKGTHLTKKKVIKNEIIKYTKEKTLTVTANGESLRLCTDGEITTQKRIEFSMVEDAFRFIVPAVL